MRRSLKAATIAVVSLMLLSAITWYRYVAREALPGSPENTAVAEEKPPRTAEEKPARGPERKTGRSFIEKLKLTDGKEATAAEKREFFKFLGTLKVHGEFFEDESVARAVPHVRVLLSLTEDELKGLDIYPFIALSNGLLGHRESRNYATKNFQKIAHPTLKLGWASMLFDGNVATPEIVSYLRGVLESKELAKELAGMSGPNFEDLKARINLAYERSRQWKVEFVKQHTFKDLPSRTTMFSFDRSNYVLAQSARAHAVFPLEAKGEVFTFNITDGKTTKTAIDLPAGYRPRYGGAPHFDHPVIEVNPRGDQFCLVQLGGNGDHEIALRKNGDDSFRVKHLQDVYLMGGGIVADSDGDWYLLETGNVGLAIHHVDPQLKVTRIGKFPGRGEPGAAAQFISRNIMHFFWMDSPAQKNQIRLRTIDFDVSKREWLHDRELFRFEPERNSMGARCTALQYKDKSLHYLWSFGNRYLDLDSELNYQAESESKPVYLFNVCEFTAAAADDRIAICYTQNKFPRKLFFRVVQHGIAGPPTELDIGKQPETHDFETKKKREIPVDGSSLILSRDGERFWFVNTQNPTIIHELKLVEADQPK